MTQAFNPLLEVAKPKAKQRQSLDLAPDPVVLPKLDSTTPAVKIGAPRRFDLNDLPRFANQLYPRLLAMFPHINERMYGGWLRGCINDNACLFVVAEDEEKRGACGMAFIAHDPLSPVPYVDVFFVIGPDDMRKALYEKIVTWGTEVSAKEVRIRDESEIEILNRVKSLAKAPEQRPLIVLHLE